MLLIDMTPDSEKLINVLWKRVKNVFWLVIILIINVLLSLLLSGKISYDVFIGSLTLAGIFYLIITQEEKHDKTILLLKDIEKNTRQMANGGTRLMANGGEFEEEDEEEETSGAGAFAGMIVGGSIGLLAGPVGVILGGIIGALIGNELERETKK